MGKTKTKSRSVGDSPKPPITIRSTNLKVIDDNIAKLEAAIKSGDVEANPSGTAEETLLSSIGIDGKKYDLGPSAENTSYDNTDSGLIADDVQSAIDELKGNTDYSVYHYNGVIINGTSPSIISGEGSAVIELCQGIAKITFEAIIKTADESENFAYGINRDLFETITGKTITPVDKGILLYYTSGAIDSSLTGNCGIPEIINNEGKYWRPARAFTGGSGGWASNAFAQNTRISGIIYGTYTI
jgi:hypothetical protein